MVVEISLKDQVMFPRRVLNALGVRHGGPIELVERPDGFLLRPR